MIGMKKLHLLILAAFLIGSISSCKLLMGPVGLADRHLERGEFQPAIENYQKALDKGKNTAKVNYNLAESFRLSNRIHQAMPYYLAADTLASEESALPVYYGQALKANEQYAEALRQFRRYLAEGEDRELLAIARTESRGLPQIPQLPDSTDIIEISNLSALNTSFPEYGLSFHKNYLYFTSTRSGGDTYLGTGTPFSKLYRTPFSGFPIDSAQIEELSEITNLPKINEGTIAIHPSGNMMVFARGNTGKRKGAVDVNLYITYLRDSVWTTPELMSINDPEAWDSTPTFSADGSTLYFASNRAGGIGGIDLYSARLDERGNWSGVRNMGSVINTPGNEMFPYVGPDEKLYFSSDGHPGLGGLDLFVAERTEDELIITSMGKPYNSNFDDFGLLFFDYPNEGLFVSNRPGGAGDDDIYRFSRSEPVKVEKIITYLINGRTLQLNDDGSTSPLPNVALQLLDSVGNVVATSKSSPTGAYTFTVGPEQEYTILGEKPEFFAKRQNYSTKEKTVDPESFEEETRNEIFEVDVIMEAIVIDKAIVLENIYYDFDRAEIREDAALELNKLVQVMKDNPGITIELSAHTDSRGSDAYNRDLSQRRAESAVAYIVSQGIAANRLEARGYGASRPIAPNTNPDGSDNPEGRQLNRRTEFKVIRQD
jgi:outer membrane protein OmpA-like peptidoglycan-associated protein